jgi:hypothetical protein
MRPASHGQPWTSRGKGSARRVKVTRSVRRDRAGDRRTRTRKEAQARESGHGSPRREGSEGKLQERERHGTGPRNSGAQEHSGLLTGSSVPDAARTVEREPTLRTAPVRAWQPSPTTVSLTSVSSRVVSGETGRPEQCVQGARSSGEAKPAGKNVPRRVSERCGECLGVATRRRNSGEEPTPREDDPGTRVPGTRSSEEYPVAACAARGAPQAKQGATRGIGASEGEREPQERQAARG